MAKPKGRSRRPKLSGNKQERRLNKMLDDLAEFDDFKNDLLKKIRQALRHGHKSEDILDFGRAYAAARLVNIAATEEDNTKALAAVKDLLDRTQGKAVERKSITHNLQNLPDDQLDSLLMSEIDEVSEDSKKLN